MSINLKEIPPLLIDAASTANLVPFIGAGVSKQAITNEKQPFPTWKEFIEGLRDFASTIGYLQPNETVQIQDLIDRGQFLMVGQALKDGIPKGELELHIKHRFDPRIAVPGPIHEALLRLTVPLIMTTNYDTLLEKAYTNAFPNELCKPATHEDAHEVQQVLKGYRLGDRPLIFKIHGTVTSPEKIVFAERDYQELMYGNHGYRAVMSAVFVTKVVLMLGFSFTDPEVVVLTETLRQWFKKRSSPDYIVLPKGIKTDVEKKRLRTDFGIVVIEYESSGDDHPELLEIVEFLGTFSPQHASHTSSWDAPSSDQSGGHSASTQPTWIAR